MVGVCLDQTFEWWVPAVTSEAMLAVGMDSSSSGNGSIKGYPKIVQEECSKTESTFSQSLWKLMPHTES